MIPFGLGLPFVGPAGRHYVNLAWRSNRAKTALGRLGSPNGHPSHAVYGRLVLTRYVRSPIPGELRRVQEGSLDIDCCRFLLADAGGAAYRLTIAGV